MPEEFGFEDALANIKLGKLVSRFGWNGRGMYLGMQTPFASKEASSEMMLPYIYMVTVDKKTVPWVASHTDLFAEDWYVSV